MRVLVSARSRMVFLGGGGVCSTGDYVLMFGTSSPRRASVAERLVQRGLTVLSANSSFGHDLQQALHHASVVVAPTLYTGV